MVYISVLIILTCTVTALSGFLNEWSTFENSRYRVYREVQSWDTAQNKCREDGATLAEMETEREYYFVFRQVSLNHVSSSVWVGATDESIQNEWRWINANTTLKYSKWSPGEPNGGSHENCLSLTPPPNGLYNDLSCSTRIPFVCEFRFTAGANILG